MVSSHRFREPSTNGHTILLNSCPANGVRVGSNNSDRRAILDAVCLNRAVGKLGLALVKRKPFDVLAEGLDLSKSRGDRIRTCDFVLPKHALCQTELRPVMSGGF